MGSPVPAVLDIVPVDPPKVDYSVPGTKRPLPAKGERGYIGGIPIEEVRRIRAKARRYADGHHAEFVKEAMLRMYEQALKLEAMTRYAEDPTIAAQCAAGYRKAVADVIAAHTPVKAKK